MGKQECTCTKKELLRGFPNPNRMLAYHEIEEMSFNHHK